MNLGRLFSGLAPVANAAGDAVLGIKKDKDDAVAKALAQRSLDRQQQHQDLMDGIARDRAPLDRSHVQAQTAALEQPKILGALTDPTTGEVFNRMGDGTIAPAKPAKPAAPAAAPTDTIPPAPKPALPIKSAPVAGAGFKVHPKAADDNVLVQVQLPDGSIVYRKRSEAVNEAAPQRAAVGSAALKKAIATNRTQLSVIDDALKELAAHPDAVGLKRGVGEMVPFLGGIQDAVNQRVDPGGVSARASISNIGSLVIHDRSGAAVTISEFPRLKPFIPGPGDTPQAIREKMAKLRAALETETGLIQEQMGGGSFAPTASSGPKSSAPPSYEEWLKARKP